MLNDGKIAAEGTAEELKQCQRLLSAGLALGAELALSFAGTTGPAPSAPQSLVRFAYTSRFRHHNNELAATLGVQPDELNQRIVMALAAFSDALGIDPGDAGWGRLMDALVLIVQHPIPSGRG